MEQKPCVELSWLGLPLLYGRIGGRRLHGDLLCDTSDLAARMKLLMGQICIMLLYSYRYDLVLMRLGLMHDGDRM